MHLEHAHGDLPNPRFFNEDDPRLLRYELYIQESTTIEYLGYHVDAPVPSQNEQEVDFQTICDFRGQVGMCDLNHDI